MRYLTSRSRASVAGALLIMAGVLLPSATAQPFKVVNVIPKEQSQESEQNSEPSLAVNPLDTSQALIGAFNDRPGVLGTPQPYFFSANSGLIWTNVPNTPQQDTTPDWNESGSLYVVMMNNTAANTVDIFRSTVRNGAPALVLLHSYTHAGMANLPDHPWIRVFPGAGGRGPDLCGIHRLQF